MKIQFIKARHYIGIGDKHEGEFADVDSDLAEQLISQGCAVKATEDKKSVRSRKEVMIDKSDFKSYDKKED